MKDRTNRPNRVAGRRLASDVRHHIRCMIKFIAKFAAALLGMTILSTIVWAYVGDRLYCCTDPTGFGFLSPGNWDHSFPGHPIEAVPKIDQYRSMSEGDAIKDGWTVTRLWCLWYSFLAASVLASLWLAWIRWLPRYYDDSEPARAGGSGTKLDQKTKLNWPVWAAVRRPRRSRR